MLHCGIIGLGGLGKVHFKNLSEMGKKDIGVKIVALCDVEEKKITEKVNINLGEDKSEIDPAQYSIYTDAEKMLKNEKLDFVVTALPTYLHADIAVMALDHGLHVFSEKPMALTVEEGQRMLDASKRNGKLLMIGQCLRYWPEYRKLKQIIDDGEFGKVIRAEFSRYSSLPVWSWQNWYLDEKKSGGAALDLHVHDVDTVNWLFGAPASVFSSATHNRAPYDSISTIYQYPDKTVCTVADWGAHKLPFSMEFMVRLEQAVVTKDKQGFSIFTKDEILKPEIEKGDAYYNEIFDFIRCINENQPIKTNPPESSMLSLKIALAEKESARAGGLIKI